MSSQSDHPLTPCPASPNCVSSLASDKKHLVMPFMLVNSAAEAWPDITAVVLELPRCKIVEQRSGYLHAEVRSRIFRFVDHLELAATSDGKRVDVRSASVTGYSDLGVNRQRIETLRNLLQEAGLLQ